MNPSRDRGLRFAVCSLILCGAAANVAAAEPVATIQNDSLRVTYDTDSGTLTIDSLPDGKRFITDGVLTGPRGTAQTTEVTDKVFGTGSAIEIRYESGAADRISLFPQLPFALFRATFRRPEPAGEVLNRVRTLSVGLDLGRPAVDLKSMGTGGLSSVDQNPGSYAWQAIVDPASRRGVVGGWLTHDRGSGVVFTSRHGQQARLDARIDYGRLRIADGQTADGEVFALGIFADARLGLEAWADAVAKVYRVKLPPQPVGYCTWYSDKHDRAGDEVHLAELAAFAEKQLKPFGLDFIQIDDNWQDGESRNGPRRSFTTHAPKGPYPAGMKATAENLKRHGLTPGIWFMPFAGTSYDPFFKDHQDWFVKRENGEPYETEWGGTCLDMTQSGAREYLRGLVQRLAHEWGYLVFKMDGLWTGSGTKQIYINQGYRDDGMGDAVFANPDKTNIEAYRDGLKLVRQVAGQDVFLLGCCAAQNMRSYGGAFGLVDSMRVGPDTGSSPAGAAYGARHYFLHGRVWYNDPDCVGVRANIPLAKARMWASWVAISGQLYLDSDWLPDLPPERLDILRRTMLPHGRTARPVDYFDVDQPRIWLVSDGEGADRRDIVALFNWSNQPADFDVPLASLGLPADVSYLAFDFWDQAFLPPVRGRLRTRLPQGACQIIAMRPQLNRPQVLSTSRHVTQGLVDVSDEAWDATADTLAGSSRVVAADPYELRLAAHGTEQGWAIAATEVSAADQAAGVKIHGAEANGVMRVTIESPVSREVAWTVRFRRVAEATTPPAAVRSLQAQVEMGTPLTLTWDGGDGLQYEVRREPGGTATTSGRRFVDQATEPGTEYRYHVTAITWNGRRSESRELTVTTQPLPPEPPRPDVRLTSLKPLQSTVGFGSLGVGKTVTGKPLTISGRAYPDGLGVHAVSKLTYERRPEFQRLVAVGGLDDGIRRDGRASVVMKVVADCGKPESQRTLAASPVLSIGTCEKWHFDVALPPECERVLLIVEDAGDGTNADHANWVDAGFIATKNQK